MNATATAMMVDADPTFGTKLREFIAKIDWNTVFLGTLAFTGATVLGVYTAVFVSVGGWLWILAVPYAMLTAMTAGFSVYCFAHPLKGQLSF